MIHRYWSGPPAPNAAWMLTALETMNPEVEVRDWTDDTLPTSVLAWLTEHELDVVGEDRMRHRANLVRYWALERFGGWWVDHDVVMLKPFDALPYPAVAAHVGRTCTCILGFPAEHPLMKAAIGAVSDPVGVPGRSPMISGERMLDSLRPFHGPDVAMLTLPFDALGRATGAEPWAVHLYRTTVSR